MAFPTSNPSTQTNGADMGQTEWNELVNDLIYLYTALSALAVKSGEGYEQIVSDNSENTVATFPITASGLGANGFLRSGTMAICYNNTGTSTYTATIKHKYGATTLLSYASNNLQTANYIPVMMTSFMANRASESSQIAIAEFARTGNYGSLTSTVSNAAVSDEMGHNSASEDSSGALDFVHTITLSNNNANLWSESWCWLEGPVQET